MGLKEFSSSTRFEDRLEYLFTKYGAKGKDFSSLKKYGLISGSGRQEMIVEKGELSGFQNDNLVLAFSIDSNERITFEYCASHLIDTAKALIEILWGGL